jgi:hypothetical protein
MFYESPRPRVRAPHANEVAKTRAQDLGLFDPKGAVRSNWIARFELDRSFANSVATANAMMKKQKARQSRACRRVAVVM